LRNNPHPNAHHRAWITPLPAAFWRSGVLAERAPADERKRGIGSGPGRRTQHEKAATRGATPRVHPAPRPASEGDTATSFELFFDLVYVFGATRVTTYIVHAHDTAGVLQGLLILALLWSTWAGYAWLGNQAGTDTGTVRGAMAVAMAAMFVVALAIPEAWHDGDGGLNGPLTLVIAYVLVRCVHLAAYALVARDDFELRHQVAIAMVPTVIGAALLVGGVLLGGRAQTALFAGAVVVEWGGLYLTSRGGSWRLHSASHLTERHGLFVLLAIGESLFAIGAGAADQAISAPLLSAAVLGVAAALGLWWVYFDRVSRTAEHRLRDMPEPARLRMAIDAYSYGHFPIVAGIILGAVGVEGVLAHAGDDDPLGPFYAAMLFGGFALYLAGNVLFQHRTDGSLAGPRVATAGILLLALAVAASLPPLVGLAGLVLALGLLIVFETRRYAAYGDDLRLG
jgi:low temperature requirement protein LtrA